MNDFFLGKIIIVARRLQEADPLDERELTRGFSDLHAHAYACVPVDRLPLASRLGSLGNDAPHLDLVKLEWHACRGALMPRDEIGHAADLGYILRILSIRDVGTGHLLPWR